MTQFILDIETTGLTPITRVCGEQINVNKIICISLLNLENSSVISYYGEDENKILQQFWNSIKTSDLIVGFNIEFDLSFIRVKSLLNGVKFTKNPAEIKIIDLREVIYPNNKYGVGKLRDFCDLLLIPYTTHNGSEMNELYCKRDWKEIKAHCEEDVKITYELYKKLKDLNFIN